MGKKLERVVVGHKAFFGIDDDGKRVQYLPGDTCLVTASQARVFSDRLKDPKVVAAQAAAAKAEQEATPVEDAPPKPVKTPNVQKAAEAKKDAGGDGKSE